MRTYYLQYEEEATINYLYLFLLHRLAEVDKALRLYNTVRYQNLEELTNRLEFLIKNVDFVKKVGENAKRDIYITWEDVCEKLRKIYEKYLNSYTLQYSKNNKNKTTKKRKINS